MRIFCLITVLLMSIVGISIAQPTGSRLTEPDAKQKFVGFSHIEADLGQRNTLLIGFDRYAQVQARQNIDSVLRLFVADYQKVEDTTQSQTRATHALFRLGDTDRALALRYTPQLINSFRFRDGEEPIQVKTNQDTLQIVWTSAVSQTIHDDFSMYLFVNSLHDIDRLLRSGGINQKLQQALESIRQYKAHDLTSPKMAFNMVQDVANKPTFLQPGLAKSPFLSLHPSIGVGLIRNDWVPSLNLDLEFVPSRFRRISYSIGYISNFFFRQSEAGYYNFLNLGISFYRYNKDGRTVAFNRQIGSFYVGFPVHKSNSYFEKNTIRLGGTVYQNGLFKVQPEIYMNEFFKNVYPGLRLVVGF
ncbi:hypothetical protein [Spirosoma endophyticum]|uniref:Uncharacterized protein n=1 Tax=Spirosoma endophyticum TaxID=662367 RepID=A0A1I1YCN5_9BACT|nr:hypothetical protein [Spirosoma endophyticum]SFE17072.1 hypothetical protein SAMN05216167_1118 [Spirosoma endophyticum]